MKNVTTISIRQKIFSFIPTRIKDLAYSLLRFLYDYSRFLFETLRIWLMPRLSPTNICHMLACQRPEYVAIAKFAISSFLYFNPKYKIILHTDEHLNLYARKLNRYFPESRLSIVQDIPNSGYPYELKGKLLLKMQGTHDIFLDVDTRTNGVLPEIMAPLTLVAEFRMKDNVNFRRILHELELSYLEDYYLLNVSIVSWGGRDYNISSKEFEEWSTKYMEIQWHKFLDSEQIPYFKRFVEQVFLSIKLQASDFQILKEKDYVGDKGLVESSYFGASGYRFGR